MSGSLNKAFLADIAANIDDDTPRLVYADWLTENGQDDRAEFIRVQIEQARLPNWDAAQVRLRLREAELLKQHKNAWLAEMPVLRGVEWVGFRRGLIAEVAFNTYEGMRKHAAACRAVAPVEAVSVYWPRKGEARKDPPPIAELRELVLHGRPDDREMRWLARSPQLATLRSLSLLGLSIEDLDELLASPHLGNLRVLRLLSNGIGNAGVEALTEAETLTGLEELDLTGPGYYESYYDDPIITEVGAANLADWPGLATVRSLSLDGSNLGDAGLRRLLTSPHAEALKELSLRGGRFDGPVMAAFGEATPGLRLESLDLGENLLGEAGARHLAQARCLNDLKVLRLDRCEIPLAGAQALAQAPFLPGLRLLDVGHNSFGPAGLAALLEAGVPALHTLQISFNDLFDKGAALLAGSPAADGLVEIDLSHNGLSAEGAQALGESPHLRSLLVLRLAANGIYGTAADTLHASPLGRRLSVLELVAPPRRRYGDPSY